MDEIKSILLTPDILEDCLRDESFHVIKQKRDIILSIDNTEESKCSKYIGNSFMSLFTYGCFIETVVETKRNVNIALI